MTRALDWAVTPLTVMAMRVRLLGPLRARALFSRSSARPERSPARRIVPPAAPAVSGHLFLVGGNRRLDDQHKRLAEIAERLDAIDRALTEASRLQKS